MNPVSSLQQYIHTGNNDSPDPQHMSDPAYQRKLLWRQNYALLKTFKQDDSKNGELDMANDNLVATLHGIVLTHKDLFTSNVFMLHLNRP